MTIGLDMNVLSKIVKTSNNDEKLKLMKNDEDEKLMICFEDTTLVQDKIIPISALLSFSIMSIKFQIISVL